MWFNIVSEANWWKRRPRENGSRLRNNIIYFLVSVVTCRKRRTPYEQCITWTVLLARFIPGTRNVSHVWRPDISRPKIQFRFDGVCALTFERWNIGLGVTIRTEKSITGRCLVITGATATSHRGIEYRFVWPSPL